MATTKYHDYLDIYNSLKDRKKILETRIIDLHKASNVVFKSNPYELLDAYRLLNENNNLDYASNVINSWYQYHVYLELSIVNIQLSNMSEIIQNNKTTN
jgi:hypothetical protein